MLCGACAPIPVRGPAATLYQTEPGYAVLLHWEGVHLNAYADEKIGPLGKYQKQSWVYLRKHDRRVTADERDWIPYASDGDDMWIIPQYPFTGTLLLAADHAQVRVAFPGDNYLMGDFNGDIAVDEFSSCLGAAINDRYRQFDYQPYAEILRAVQSNEVVRDGNGHEVPLSDLAISYVEEAYRWYIKPNERFIQKGGWPKAGEHGVVFLPHRFRGLPPGHDYVGVVKRVYRFSPEQTRECRSWIEANLGPDKRRLDVPWIRQE
ncbi:hypothetical protein DB354_10485 [Opitutus sp. ER46]|nr:hypothetical protein DB354_10485 [Opitutus sp. ER46]